MSALRCARGVLFCLAVFLSPVCRGASAEEATPQEAFAAAPADSDVWNLPADLLGPGPGEEGAQPDNDAEPMNGTSLWDTFTGFFDLGSGGNPGQTDKLRLTVATTLGYDDNVFATNTDQIASATAGLNGTLRYLFGTERLQIAANLGLGVTVYENRPGDRTDYNGTFSTQVSYQMNRRLLIKANLAVSYLSQPNPTLIGGVSRFSGDYWSTAGNIEAAYSLLPRLSTRAGYSYNAIQYTDEAINQGQGFTDQTINLGIDYLFLPRLTLSGEYRFNRLSYYESGQDSNGHILTVGFSATFAPKLTWNLQFGAEARMLNNATSDAMSEYLGPFLESDFTYGFRPGSALVASVRYGTEPSGVAGISIRETLRGSLGVTYSFGARFIADVGLTYQNDRYDQPGETNDYAQQYFTAYLGLRYRFNPSVGLTGRYEYSNVNAENEADGYTRNITTLGLEVIF